MKGLGELGEWVGEVCEGGISGSRYCWLLVLLPVRNRNEL